MGWMSWEIFRCNLETKDDDCTDPLSTLCISDALYRGTVDALARAPLSWHGMGTARRGTRALLAPAASPRRCARCVCVTAALVSPPLSLPSSNSQADQGYIAAGYSGVHFDDCWEQLSPTRDPATGELVPNPTRFPNGMKSLGDYIHARGGKFGLYTAESATTCGGYPASLGHEALDARTFGSWGVDYLKVDGCGEPEAYAQGYKDMGRALLKNNSGRDIVLSCSWPAYIGDDERTKPFATFVDDLCHTWRNWDDIQCSWGSLVSIIEHWGIYGEFLAGVSPGYWHDADMLLAGNDCVTDDEARTQMAIWSIIASPLIMGNDVRNITKGGREILLNAEAIAVNQDRLGLQGFRISPAGATEVWARNISGDAVAVALFNKLGTEPVPPQPCPTWNVSHDGYLEACGGPGGNVGSFASLSVEEAQQLCCDNALCASFSYAPGSGDGFYKGNTDCGLVSLPGYDGYAKPVFTPPVCEPRDVTVRFEDVPALSGGVARYGVMVRDIWAHTTTGPFYDSYTAKAVPCHGSAFITLTPNILAPKPLRKSGPA